jgi:hypothetical protein
MTLAVYTHLTKFKEDEAIRSLNEHLDKVATLEPQSSKSIGSEFNKNKKRDDLER